ncbi:UNVERIFIED_CONTAM: ferritin-like domain-containing protein, partial [Salmonella enterica subsp. enterica serovar Weltevreden]
MNIASLPLSDPALATGPLELDRAALQRVQQQMQDGAVTPAMSPWAADIVRLLNGALATELVCVLRYKRHHFTATGLNAPAVAAEFMAHANEEAGHADRLATRIVQLGGAPDFSP